MFDHIFTWGSDWDQTARWEYVFRDAVLVRDLGRFRAGTQLLEARVNFRTGKLSITTNLLDEAIFTITPELTPAAIPSLAVEDSRL